MPCLLINWKVTWRLACWLKNNFPVWERESGGYISNLCAGPKLSLAALHNLDVFGYDFGHGVQRGPLPIVID